MSNLSCSPLGPLSLNESLCIQRPLPLDQVIGVGAGAGECSCPCCETTFSLPKEQQSFLKHLLSEHKLVIADLDKIALLADYVKFWKPKFQEHGLEEYCTTMLADAKYGDNLSKNEKFYLLSDVLPIDNQIRRDLQQQRLEMLLSHQKQERDDKSYSRECLFCRTVLEGSRSDFLTHLNDKHNFYIAKLENLIFTSDLIEFINDKLENNICIYCEKVFKDRVILKEHMRKKGHKKINPSNCEYDKYFISNYMELGKNWQSYLKNVGSFKKPKSKNIRTKLDQRDSSGSESDSNWSDWEEKENLSIVCLFCKKVENKYNEICDHMVKEHCFNFEYIMQDRTFYEKLKIVNYIRRQVYLKKCMECNEEFNDTDLLLNHMMESKHFTISSSTSWNQPEFYFPTYEDDGLLFCLDDNDDLDDIDLMQKNKIAEMCSDKNHISQKVALSVIDS